jgi:cell division protein ZapA (FtsZ GTPase activity inhibitor)
MENQESRHITVIIAGRPYPLKVRAEDEATIRQIVGEVNDKVNRFQLAHPNKDKQDCLSMVLLTYAVDLFKIRQINTPDPEVLENRLARLHSLLEAALSPDA